MPRATTITTAIIKNGYSENVTISSVTGASEPYTVTLASAPTSSAKVGMLLYDEAATRRAYLITAISGSDLTVQAFDSGTDTSPPDNSGTSTPTIEEAYTTITLWEADLDVSP